MIPLKDENPTRTKPYVTLSLMAVNVLVFLFQISLPESAGWLFIHRFGVIPVTLTHFVDPFPADGWPVALTPFTGLFLHGGLMHLAGNMLYLWIFGDNVEDILGHFRFLIFYLLCGLTATLIYVATDAVSTMPLIGASGAIAGVMGAYLILFPRARVLTLFILIIYPLLVWVPAVLILGLWFLVQFLSAGGAGDSSVAWIAHIAGFICGMIAVKLMAKRPPARHVFRPQAPPGFRYPPAGPRSYH